MRKERKVIAIDRIQLNEGQLDWLPKNPRQWTQTDIDKTAASIIEDPDFLEDRPLLVVPFGKEFVAFGGNLRHEGCKAAKKPTAPCMVYSPETDEDYATIKRRAMKDNGSFGSWDFDELANNWDDLPLGAWGVKAWPAPENPNQGEVAGNGGDATEAHEDDFDEEKDEILARCKLGDIWQLGDHRLMCGDSTDLTSVQKLMGGMLADLWVTDPPYNVDYEEKEQYKVDLGYASSKHDVAIANDKMKDKEFLDFLTGAFCTATAVLKDGCPFYIWHADTERYNFLQALRNAKKLHFAEFLVWVKDRLCFGRQDYHWQHEPCLYGWKLGAGHKWYSDRSQTTRLEYPKPQKSELHPTMKPVPLISYLMKNSSQEGDLVLDTFGGSGTTLVVAEQLHRRCCMMEISPHYCDVIIARWEKETGKTAVQLS